MSQARPGAHERSAAVVLAVVLDGSIRPRDVAGAPDATHDFDLIVADKSDLTLADGRRIAVEVTRVLSARQLQQQRALAVWTTADLQLAWHVVLRDEAVRVNKLRRVVEQVLRSIEKQIPGIPFPESEDEGQVSAQALQVVPQALIDVGVVDVMFFPCWEPIGTVMVGPPLSVSKSFEAAFPDIEEAIRANAEKLARSVADERHLFVWIERPHQSHGTYTLKSEQMPVGELQFAPGVDVVWVAGSVPSGDCLPLARVVWRYTTGEGWSRHGTFLEFWRALGMRRQLGMPPDPESHSTESRYTPDGGWPEGWRALRNARDAG